MRAQDIPIGNTRIGVNTGKAVIGKFGGAHFFNFSVYGFDVVLAARLEGANKVLGTRICISEKTVAQCPDFRGRPVGDLILRGASDPLRSYEPLIADASGDDFIEAYGNAFELLENRAPEARHAYANFVSQYPDDPVASLHLSRLLTKQYGSVIEI
jgi:adenylate cyclase